MGESEGRCGVRAVVGALRRPLSLPPSVDQQADGANAEEDEGGFGDATIHSLTETIRI